jgi:hypothetical protein
MVSLLTIAAQKLQIVQRPAPLRPSPSSSTWVGTAVVRPTHRDSGELKIVLAMTAIKLKVMQICIILDDANACAMIWRCAGSSGARRLTGRGRSVRRTAKTAGGVRLGVDQIGVPSRRADVTGRPDIGRSRRGPGLPMPAPGVTLRPKSRSSGGCRFMMRKNDLLRNYAIKSQGINSL